MKKIAILLLLLFAIGATACDITGDDSGDGKTTRAAWTTHDATNKYYPARCHPIARISHDDQQEIQLLLSLAPQVTVVEEPFRLVETTSQWKLTSYTVAPHWWPFKMKINGTWVSTTSPITLELHSTHQPKSKPHKRWVPNDGTDPENPVDPDNTSTWGEWVD